MRILLIISCLLFSGCSRTLDVCECRREYKVIEVKTTSVNFLQQCFDKCIKAIKAK